MLAREPRHHHPRRQLLRRLQGHLLLRRRLYIQELMTANYAAAGQGAHARTEGGRLARRQR